MIDAVVMVGEPMPADTYAGWVRGAQRVAAADLVHRLLAVDAICRVIVCSPSLQDWPFEAEVEFVATPAGNIHVGQQLAALVEQFDIQRLLYFGGGSAPLLDDETLHTVIEQLQGPLPILVANNRFGTDWAGVAPAGQLAAHVEQLPKDNMLGWVMSTAGGMNCTAFPASTGTRFDIDTPADLLTLALHPHISTPLRLYLNSLPLETTVLQNALQVLATPAAGVFCAGRIAPAPWAALNSVTRCWIRVFSEERGMISSGRQMRGEARSFLADYLNVIGVEQFMANIELWCDAAFIDTRVMLAHNQLWPSDQDRFASDLGLADQIHDPFLAELTHAASQASVPIILGGHSLMAGHLFAFCDILHGNLD